MLAPLVALPASVPAFRRLAPFRCGAAHLLVALGHRRPARKAHTAFLVYAQALYPNLIAHLDDIFGLFNAEIRELTDMDQAISARQKFDEGAKVFNRDNLAAIDFPYFRFGRHSLRRRSRY
jgi:hypothetical protein